MANTVTKDGNVVSVTFDGAAAFDLAAYLSAPHVRLRKLVLYPAAANDVFTVRQGGASGPVLYKCKDTAGAGRDPDFPGVPCKPYVKGDEVPANGLISFIFE
jgi:hypothetical protein